MGSIVNRRRVMSSEIKVPYDRVEYLESTGKQWIDTGINPMTAPSAIADIEIIGSRGYDLWGNDLTYNSDSNGHFICDVQNYELKYYRYGSYKSRNFGLIGEGRHVITTDQRLIVDGSLVYQSSYTYTHDSRQKNIWIFNASRNALPGCMKLYSFKLYDAGELVRDYIPVRVGTTGYLYDKVSGKLFGNEGTGNFILGPDVK